MITKAQLAEKERELARERGEEGARTDSEGTGTRQARRSAEWRSPRVCDYGLPGIEPAGELSRRPA